MGVTALLQAVKEIGVPIHLKELKGKTLGIDGFSWLYKGAFGCAQELVTRGNASGYVAFFMERIKLIQSMECIPFVVLDGAALPQKEKTNADRKVRKDENRRLAELCLERGDQKGAMEHYQRAVSVTPLMARTLIMALKREKIPFVVAPYEADAQLAYLALNGDIDVVVTEDSDLLVYGAPRILYKMDRNGHGMLFESAHLKKINRGLRLDALSHEQFTYACVMSGCDFFPGIPGLGMKKAAALVFRYRTLSRILYALRARNTQNELPDDFETQFRFACAVFSHQRVFDMERKELVHLHPIASATPGLFEQTEIESELEFLGPLMDPTTAIQIANGDLNPITKQLWITEQVDSAKDSAENVEKEKNERRLSSQIALRAADLNDARALFPNVHSGNKRVLRAAAASHSIKKWLGKDSESKASVPPAKRVRASIEVESDSVSSAVREIDQELQQGVRSEKARISRVGLSWSSTMSRLKGTSQRIDTQKLAHTKNRLSRTQVQPKLQWKVCVEKTDANGNGEMFNCSPVNETDDDGAVHSLQRDDGQILRPSANRISQYTTLSSSKAALRLDDFKSKYSSRMQKHNATERRESDKTYKVLVEETPPTPQEKRIEPIPHEILDDLRSRFVPVSDSIEKC